MKNKKVKVSPESTSENREPESQGSMVSRPTPDVGEYKMVARELVRPDPNQPRKVFNEEKLNELAESIRLNGIISPLVVRFMPAEIKVHEPDMINTQWHATDQSGAVVFEGDERAVKMFAKFRDTDGYQIIFGERRWRASGIAGLETIPVIVRDLSERDVFKQQFVENNQRENLTALEEAESFRDRIAKEKETNPAFNADKLAEILGIARATVYNRLTLTRLTPAVHEALTAGKIQTTVAGLVAMIPDPKEQEKLLKKLTNEDDWQFPFSFRDVEELIDEEYCKQLKDAPFDQKDPELMHVMGMGDGTVLYGGPCSTCVARTGNMKEAFPHIKNLNVCTKPECFQKKCLAHFAAEAAAAERAGKKVMTEKEFKKIKSQHAPGNEYSGAEGKYYEPWTDLLGKKMPEPVVVVTSAGLKEFYPKEALIAAAEAKGAKFSTSVKPLTKEERAAEEEKRQKAVEQQERREKLVCDLAPALLKCLGKLSDKLAWELAGEMVASLDWPDRDLEKLLLDEAKGPKAVVLARCFADGGSYPLTHSGEWNEKNVELWKRAGVDLLEEEKKRADETPEALPLKKAEAKQKELLAVKKNKKKGKK